MNRLYERLKLQKFAVIGRCGLDLYANPAGTRIPDAGGFVTALGGSGGNIAAGLARQGMAVDLVSRLSDDAVGQFCRAELDRYGIGAVHVATEGGEARTSLAVVETRPADARTVIYRNGAADLRLTVQDVERLPYAGLGALIITGTALAAEPSRAASIRAADLASKAGALVVLDVDHRAYSWPDEATARAVCLPLARMADIVIGNDDEFDLLADGQGGGLALARSLGRTGRGLAVYKMGAKGCVAFTPDLDVGCGIYPVEALKPMGAGDAFMAGLMAGLALQLTLDAALSRGAASAAIVVSGIGCAPASPTTAALETFLSTHRQRPFDAHSAV